MAWKLTARAGFALAAAAAALCAPGVANASPSVHGGAVLAGDHAFWAIADPGGGSRPAAILSLDSAGRRREIFSLPAHPGNSNKPQALAASPRRVAFVRNSSPKWNPLTGRYESGDWRRPQVWASGPDGWRLLGETGSLTRTIDVEAGLVAFPSVDGGIVIVDEAGAAERIEAPGLVTQIRMAGRFLAFRHMESNERDSIVVYDRVAGGEVYRADIPALFGTQTTPFPGNHENVVFDVDSAGTLVVVPRDITTSYGSGPLHWFSVAAPVPHRVGIDLAGESLQLVDGLVAARSPAFPEHLVVDLAGRVVDRIRLRAAGAIAFDGREYAWATNDLQLHRLPFPLTSPAVAPPVLARGAVSLRVSQPARVRVRVQRCARVAAGCRAPRTVADLRRRARPGRNRIALPRRARAKLRQPGPIRVVVQAVNAAGRRSSRATIVRR